MATELVDGKAGAPHIGGDDKGRLHAGIAGVGSYVLSTGHRLAATLDSANKVTIGTGDVLIHGRHASVTAAESVTIEAGASGQRRIDRICVVYERGADGIEAASLRVIKGEAVASDKVPDAPPVPSGNVLNGDAADWFPVWHVPVEGTAAGEPVLVAHVLPTVKELEEYVGCKRDASDTGWVTLWSSGSQYIRYRVRDGVCYLTFSTNSCGTNGWTCPSYLPATARPSQAMRAAAANVGSDHGGRCTVSPDGSVWLANYGTTAIAGLMSWPVG